MRTADEGGLRYQCLYLRVRVRGSFGERAFLFAQQKRLDLCTSVSILTDTARKLRGKFNQAYEDITGALKLISRASAVYKPSPSLFPLRRGKIEMGVQGKSIA